MFHFRCALQVAFRERLTDHILAPLPRRHYWLEGAGFVCYMYLVGGTLNAAEATAKLGELSGIGCGEGEGKGKRSRWEVCGPGS